MQAYECEGSEESCQRLESGDVVCALFNVTRADGSTEGEWLDPSTVVRRLAGDDMDGSWVDGSGLEAPGQRFLVRHEESGAEEVLRLVWVWVGQWVGAQAANGHGGELVVTQSGDEEWGRGLWAMRPRCEVGRRRVVCWSLVVVRCIADGLSAVSRQPLW